MRSGYSRYAVARWLQGKAQPRLHDFLALVEAISGRASDLVDALVSIDAVAELRAVHARRAAHRRVAFDAPWSEAALRVMETTGYRDAVIKVGYVARRLGLSSDEEQRVLAQLEAAGAVVHSRPTISIGSALPQQDLPRACSGSGSARSCSSRSAR